MTRFPKWITKSSPERRVAKVAARSLEQRMQAVMHYLPLAAAKAHEDVEYVHQLRIWARRASAVVELYRDLLPAKRADWTLRKLKRIRKAANEARDLDVLLARLSQDETILPDSPLLKHIRERRLQAQQPIEKVEKRLIASGRMQRQLEKLLKRFSARKREQAGKQPFHAWASAELRPIVEEFLRAAGGDHSDFEELHQFRISGKKLRYAMELTAGAFPREFRNQLYPRIEELLEKLGDVNDHATAQGRFRQWLETAEHAEARYLEELLEAETEQLVQSQGDFLEWWTLERVVSLTAEFQRVLGNGWCLRNPSASPAHKLGSNGSQGEPDRKDTRWENVVRKDKTAT